MTDIVTELELEVGDVIRIDTGAYNKLHTVGSITDNSSIIVDYEHAGNMGDGSLKLPDFTGQATVTRIAKWFNAPVGVVDFTIIYPNGGSEASPANVTVQTRYIEDNPFPGHNVFCVPEVLYNGEWAWPGLYSNGPSSSTGISAGQINSNEIIIQTAYLYFIYVNVASGGLHSNTVYDNSTRSLPCRVKVWKVKGATS